MPSTAVRSLFGAKKREQTVYTPQCIIDALLKLWPEGIALDPCSGPDSIVPATVAFMRVECGFAKLAGGVQSPGRDGLSIPWPERTYFNPPYNDIKPWLDKFVESYEVVGLVPVRTHRKWWRYAAWHASEICYLDPLKFHGYEQTFPAPLCAMYNGGRSTSFRQAFAPLGGFLC